MKTYQGKSLALLMTFAILLSLFSGFGGITASAEVEAYNHYIGTLHDHTIDSDGQGTPDEAYAKAKDVLGYDFFGLTDHSSGFMDFEEYDAQRKIASAYDEEGKFVTLPGFEMTWSSPTGWWGHINTFDTDWIEKRTSLEDNPLDVYYARLVDSPTSFSQFNHPGYDWGEFDDYNFRTDENDAKMNLIEIKSPSYESDYIRALDKGWHVSPMYNNDNHSATWGDNGMCSVIMAKELTHDALVAAIRANRTYSIQDKTLRMDLRGNGAVMGSRLSGVDSLSLNLKVDYAAAKIGTVRIITNGGQIVAEKTVDDNTLDWTMDVPVGDGIYYFARLITENNKYAISAPIWVENKAGLKLTNSDIGINKSGTNSPYEIRFDLQNTSGQNYTNVEVALYRNGAKDGATFTLPSLPAGMKKTVRVPAAYQAGAHDVNIVVTTKNGASTVGTSATVNLPDLLMTEFLSSSYSETSVGDAYKYLEIFNASPEEKNLSEYKLIYYTQRAETVTFDITDQVTVPAYGTVVLWLKNADDSEIMALKKNDFIKFFGNGITSAAVAEVPYSTVSGYELNGTTGHGFYMATDAGARIGFVRYNQGYNKGEDVYTNCSLKYTYAKDGRYLGIVIENSETLTPGKVTAAQVPYTAQGATVFESPDGIRLTGSDVTVTAAGVAATESANSTSMVYVNSSGDATVTVENAALAELAVSSKIKALQIETGFGGVVISGLAADALVKAAGAENVTFKFAKKTDGAKASLDLSILAGSTELALSTPVLAVIPFAGTGDMQAVYAASGENGKAVTLVSSVYSGKDGGVLAKASGGGTYMALSNSVAFDDVDGHWAKDYITFLSARSVVGGYNGQFNPAGQITRAEFTKILASVAGANVTAYSSTAFSDVAKNAWYLPYVAWAAEKGIVGGRSEKVFDPNGKVTREEMALMIQRLAQNVLNYSLAQGTEEQFADDAAISSYAKEAVYAMRAENIIGGKENNMFDPKGRATRAEAAKMMVVLILNTVSK